MLDYGYHIDWHLKYPTIPYSVRIYTPLKLLLSKGQIPSSLLHIYLLKIKKIVRHCANYQIC